MRARGARLLAAVACAAAAARGGAPAAEARVLGELWGGTFYELTEEALDLVLAMPGEAAIRPAGPPPWYTSALGIVTLTDI